jgi:N-acetyl-anhydromuramyl-L-alanine amidase AmpD
VSEFPGKYPGATLTGDSLGLASGVFTRAQPLGVTVHYTADPDANRVRRELQNMGLGYHLLIAEDGRVVQLTDMQRTVNHAGKAMWNGYSPNRTHLAVAFLSWGALETRKTGLYTWRGDAVSAYDAVLRHGKWWMPATAKQEAALLVVLRWMVSKGISPDHVCGHDECALPPGRKQDPGGSLSLPMADIRSMLKQHP